MNELTVIIAIVIMALVARGMAFAASEGQILAVYGDLLKSLPKWASKPLGGCGHCAVSIWGTAALLILGLMPENTWHWVTNGGLIGFTYVPPIYIPSLLWLLPFYWLGATGLQDLLDP